MPIKCFIQQVFVQARIWGRCQTYSSEQDWLGSCPQEFIAKWEHKKEMPEGNKYNKYFNLWHRFSHLGISVAVSCPYLLLFLCVQNYYYFILANLHSPTYFPSILL